MTGSMSRQPQMVDRLTHAEAARAEFRKTTHDLGFSLSKKKEEGSCHCLEFLGIELDSTAMQACLPLEKIEQLMGLLTICLNYGYASYHELEQICGHFVFAQSVIPLARFFTQHLDITYRTS
ncbi:hypothetical protein DFH08DRAFT_823583 [Mycena albidolilacea]|uniref:Uncharacterized protein n=1 Tax=Mycena albidolilacea TaxID=1033008 RepID=A0AAD6Z6R7_9AGAR|nr:hypothetical protein DFH08DRAFT_823583 [Mycena albidolilacea]